MQIEVLGCYGGESPECRLTCLLINEAIALDAGCLTQVLPIDRQLRVRSLLLSHSHIDHTNGLPFFLDNVFGRSDTALEIYASSPTVYAVRKHLFNASTWPDFSRLPNHLLPAVQFHELHDEVPLELDGVRFTPVPVSHVVPTHGFLIEHNGASVLWSSDTGPTERLWEVANSTAGLRAICIEVSFANQMQSIADDSLHLTPATLQRELEKLEVDVPILLHHLKPSWEREIRQQVGALGRPSVSFLAQGRTYSF